jgi:hypothetical protein
MRPSLLAGSVLLALTALGCAPSPAEVCLRMVNQLCERNFECRTDKDTSSFQYTYGANVDECKAKFYDSNHCSERTEEAQNCRGPNAGKTTFNAGRFSECQEATAALSCEDYLKQSFYGTASPPLVCGLICE